MSLMSLPPLPPASPLEVGKEGEIEPVAVRHLHVNEWDIVHQRELLDHRPEALTLAVDTVGPRGGCGKLRLDYMFFTFAQKRLDFVLYLLDFYNCIM